MILIEMSKVLLALYKVCLYMYIASNMLYTLAIYYDNLFQ